MNANTKASGRGWFSFELSSQPDIRDALFWLQHSYEAA